MEQSSAADGATVAVRPLSWVRDITPYQWRIFLVVWLGWILDSTDFGLFSFVLRPALSELLGAQASLADIGRIGGVLSMVGLLGWAVGGFIFGVIADYVGRVRTLAMSIVLFSIFTGLQGLADSPLQLGIYRCLAGVGAGAEIIVGIPLLAEALSSQHRAKITGLMMTGSAFGSLLGASVTVFWRHSAGATYLSRVLRRRCCCFCSVAVLPNPSSLPQCAHGARESGWQVRASPKPIRTSFALHRPSCSAAS
jgi:MFS family permease